MKRKITFIVVTVVVILIIILISIFLKEQNKKMLGFSDIDNTETNNIIMKETSGEETNNLININEVEVTDNNNEANETEIIEVTEENFNYEVLNSEKTVLIDFYADWCEPCKILYPIIEEIAKENKNIKVVRVNVDNEFNLSMQYQIMSIPTMVAIKNGKEVNRIIGINSKENILSILE